jgi:hypothetical protein
MLGGGSYYMFKLPTPIPPAGQPGGPPAESNRKIMWGMPIDARSLAVNWERHPERLIPEMHELMDKFAKEYREQQAAKRKK